MAIDLTQLEMKRAEFSTAWDHEFQQLKEKVKPYTTLVPNVRGDRYEFPRVGSTSMREYSDTRHAIEMDDLRFDKRSMFYRKFYNAIPLSIDERMDMKDLDYSFSLIKQEQIKAAARKFDEIALGVIRDTDGYRVKKSGDGGFIGGILGTNYRGDGGTEQVELDTTYASFKTGKGNLIPVDYKTTGDGVSSNFAGTMLDKLFYVRRRLEDTNVFDPGDKGSICVAISPAVKQLLCSMEMKLNKDYGFSQLGEAGEACYNSFTNITFIVTNMLPTMDTEDKSGSPVTGARMCCAWLRNRVGFGVWQGAEFTLKDVNDKVDVDNYLRCRGKAGCSRMDEDTVFVLPCKETLSA